MSEYPKHIKNLIRYYATLAHEEELRRALESRAAWFDEWRAGNLGSHELSQAVHEFHQGPTRDLFKRYNEPYFPLDMAIARAIVTVSWTKRRWSRTCWNTSTPSFNRTEDRPRTITA